MVDSCDEKKRWNQAFLGWLEYKISPGQEIQQPLVDFCMKLTLGEMASSKNLRWIPL